MVTKTSSSWKLSFGERRGILLAGDFIVGLVAMAVGLVVWAANAEWYGFSIEFLRERVDDWFYLLPLIWLLLLAALIALHLW